MKFSDFHHGQTLEFGSYSVSEAEIVDFASRYDPQPFHVDKAAAAASRWRGLIASGFHTCGIAMRLVVDHVLTGSESVGSPGISSLKWLKPVRAGDTLHVRCEVLKAEPSESGGTGVLVWNWQLLNQRSEIVMDLMVTSLFDLHADQRIVRA